MEIYSLYQAIKNCMLLTDDMRVIITSVAFTVGLLVAFFILQGVFVAYCNFFEYFSQKPIFFEKSGQKKLYYRNFL